MLEYKNMDNEKIKEMLLDISPSSLEFTVTQSGKESKRVNGLYKPDTHEIILHNKNFKTENELVYTAVHEYTHHLIAEEQLALNGSSYMPNAKVHTENFWVRFHSLLKIAEEKKYYSLDIEASPELKELTEKIRKEYLEVNGKLMQEFGRLLAKAHEQLALNGSSYMPNAKVHTENFWVRFHSLLKIAEEKKYYSLDIEASPELKELTEKIRKEYLEVNGKLMQEFGRLLAKAHELCQNANIRYEDYIDRVLCLPRNSARDITRVGAVSDINPSIGFDNMKMISAIKKSDERSSAQEKILSGESPATVRSLMKNKCQSETDPKQKLEKEKNRLTKTIAQLQQRLEFVEESLASM